MSQSAIVEAAVASFLLGDFAEQMEAALTRRIDGFDEDLAVLGKILAQFIHFWLTITPPLPDHAQASARAKDVERFEGFMPTLGRKLASCPRSCASIRSWPSNVRRKAWTMSAIWPGWSNWN
ncbi:hypothetical protein SAMN04489859_11182 [Paracoccus alcaliphilus]|uniref:Uncharacterized protein n=1 Tax=Paracoccus alcaliphilus TaxID=34002 RepID=A0A1H8PSS2_9RHOB|nr:hypothetical protein [Paracoccus alcaliphilus]WCR20051.1 hypothetical protein JHW40_02020 [Paracoccus alcaliphilus]SEO44758.1 hypothetical protein SAMN04489859_11182 [Paracoccus alcaliphilus]